MLHATPSASGASAGQLLVVEDDVHTQSFVASSLAQAGWDVETASDGTAGLRMATEMIFDVLIVDRLLPGLDGLEMVRRLRERRIETPTIFLTALGAVSDRVAGLEGGADDYLVKPFSLVELKARVGALARRPLLGARERTQLAVEDLVLDRLAREVRRGPQAVELLPLEFKLLEFLMLRPGQPVTRAMLLEQVWRFNFDPRTNIVETHMSRLRGKISPPGSSPLITTVRGVGYVIGAEA